jgi:hypothetical protein
VRLGTGKPPLRRFPHPQTVKAYSCGQRPICLVALAASIYTGNQHRYRFALGFIANNKRGRQVKEPFR